MARATRKSSPSRSSGLSLRARRSGITRFTRRTTDLFLAYLRSGRSTKALSRRAEKLKEDLDKWTRNHGIREIRATRTRLRNTDDDDWSCDSCEWIMVSMGRICFLVGCDPAFNNCSYICITLPRDPDYPVS